MKETQIEEKQVENELAKTLKESTIIEYRGMCFDKKTVTLLIYCTIFLITIAFGGLIFRLIELPQERLRYEQSVLAYNDHKTEIFDLLQYYNNTGNISKTQEIFVALKEHALGFEDEFHFDHQWNFIRSMLFSFTVITTIGYGRISPSTMGGRTFLVIYGIIGIPLTILTIASIAERYLFLFKLMTQVGMDKVEKAFLSFDVDDSGELNPDEFASALEKLGYELSPDNVDELWRRTDKDANGAINLEEFRGIIKLYNTDLTDVVFLQKNETRIALVGMFLWIVFGIIVFSFTEKWRPDRTFYFLFVSLTTIGLGDFVPTSKGGSIFLVIFSMVGLGLTAALIKILSSNIEYMKNQRMKSNRAKMEMEKMKKNLKKISNFASRTDSNLEHLIQKSIMLNFGPNEEIIQEIDVLRKIHVLYKGKVSVSRQNEPDKIEEISTRSLLLESSIPTSAESYLAEATICATNHVKILSISIDDWNGVPDSIFIMQDTCDETNSDLEVINSVNTIPERINEEELLAIRSASQSFWFAGVF